MKRIIYFLLPVLLVLSSCLDKQKLPTEISEGEIALPVTKPADPVISVTMVKPITADILIQAVDGKTYIDTVSAKNVFAEVPYGGKYEVAVSQEGYYDFYIPIYELKSNLALVLTLLKEDAPAGLLKIKTQLPAFVTDMNDGNVLLAAPGQRYMTPGDYNLQISRPGYISVDTAITVVNNGETVLNINLEKQINPVGRLSVSVNPELAKITVTDEDANPQLIHRGSFANIGIPVGTKTVVVEAMGFETLQQTAVIYEDEITALNVELVPVVGEVEYEVVFNSEPAGADVYIDGYWSTKTSGKVFIKPGMHHIRVQKEGYKPIDITANIDENTAYDFDLQALDVPMGFLTLIPTPINVSSVLNGPDQFSAVLLGSTARYMLEPGKYTAHCSAQGYVDSTLSFDIIDGQETQIKVELIKNHDEADPLVVSLSADPLNIKVGESAILTASYSGGVAPYQVVWSYTSSVELTQTVAPTQTTSYGFTVTDAVGTVVSDEVTVTVEPLVVPVNHQPKIDEFNVTPTTGVAPLEITFEVVASDSDGDTLSYNVDFGDGVVVAVKSGKYTYNTPGLYTVTAIVSDGELDETASKSVLVTDPANPATVMTVTSTPDGAEVYVDNVYQGVTPLSFETEPGSHEVKLQKDGYTEITETVEVVAEQENVFEFDLVEIPKTYIQATANTDSIAVFADRYNYLGMTFLDDPLVTEINPGAHYMEGVKPGWVTDTQDWFADEGKTTAIDFSLQKESSGGDTLTTGLRGWIEVDVGDGVANDITLDTKIEIRLPATPVTFEITGKAENAVAGHLLILNRFGIIDEENFDQDEVKSFYLNDYDFGYGAPGQVIIIFTVYDKDGNAFTDTATLLTPRKRVLINWPGFAGEFPFAF